MRDLKTFCQELPKCEFNVRWDSCFTKQMLRQHEMRQATHGVQQPPFTVKILQQKLMLAYGQPRNEEEAFEVEDFLNDTFVLSDIDVSEITTDIIERYRTENVVYLELRVLPKRPFDSFLRAVLEAIRDARAIYFNMVVKVLVTVELSRPREEIEEILHIAMHFGVFRAIMNDPGSQIIHGIEVLIDLNRFDILVLRNIIWRVRQQLSFIVVLNLLHVEQKRDLSDILRLGPDRLSGANILYKDDQTDAHQPFCVKHMLDLKMPLDFSYTVTQKKPLTGCLRNSVYRRLLLSGYPVFISTGFRDLYGCTLSDEYYRVATELGLDISQIYKISRLASLYTDQTLRSEPLAFLPFTHEYHTFAERYQINTSFESDLYATYYRYIHIRRPLYFESRSSGNVPRN